MDTQQPQPVTPQPAPVPQPQPQQVPVAAPQTQVQPQYVAAPVIEPEPSPLLAPESIQVVQSEVEAPVANDFSPVDDPAPEGAIPASITWSAQEYIHPDKTPIWYILFGFVILSLIAIDIFLLKSWTFSALVVVMSVAVILYIRRPARTLTYALSSDQGLYVGEQLYIYEDFKAFGLIKADGSNSIMMVPRKRFAPGVSVYFPEDAGEQIVDILGSRLPMEELKLDIFDVIVRKLRL